MRGIIVGLALFAAIVGGFSWWKYETAEAAARERFAELVRNCPNILNGIEARAKAALGLSEGDHFWRVRSELFISPEGDLSAVGEARAGEVMERARFVLVDGQVLAAFDRFPSAQLSDARRTAILRHERVCVRY